MISLWGVLASIGANLWPFLREWLFKSKSIKSWIVTNAIQILWFAMLFVMFIITYNLFHMATDAHRQLRDLRDENEELREKVHRDPKILAPYRTKIRELATENNRLTLLNMRQTADIVTYQAWMRACGMDFSNLTLAPEQYPTCAKARVYTPRPRTVAPSATPVRKKPRPKPLPRPANTDQELNRQVEDLWGR